MANLAKQHYCAQQSLRKSRRVEGTFFRAYLNDRVKYALALGKIDSLPSDDADLLLVGDDITLAQVGAVGLRGAAPAAGTPKDDDVEVFVPKMAKNASGQTVYVQNPDASSYDRESLEMIAEHNGIRIAAPGELTKVEGELLQLSRAERHPTFQWNFGWEHYVVVGRPDGMTKEFVYEFKSTGKRFFLASQKRIGFAQADLYGYFFGVPKKRVDILVKDENKREKWEEPVDADRAVELLRAFRDLDAGADPTPPDERWKCKPCEEKDGCPVRQD